MVEHFWEYPLSNRSWLKGIVLCVCTLIKLKHKFFSLNEENKNKVKRILKE